MITKVNQLSDERQLECFAAADIVGLVVGESPEALDARTALRMRTQASNLVAVQPAGGIDDPAQVHELLDIVHPDFLEFTVVDPEKSEAWLSQLGAIESCSMPKIANGRSWPPTIFP